MFDEKDEKSLEEELLQNKKQKKDEEVEINISSNKKHFNSRFKSLQIKYKKDPKKFIVLASSIFVMLSMLIGSSYAYLTMTSKTNSSVTINAGSLALTFQNEANTISLQDVVPMSDGEGLAQLDEYSFDIKNNGSIPATYTITLDNTCQTGENIDLCIPDDYIKVGLKIGNNDYEVLEKKGTSYILDTGTLQKRGIQTYKMKVWLDYDTPNTYNAKNSQNIVYQGRLGLAFEQGVIENAIYRSSDQSISIGAALASITNATTDYRALEKNLLIKHVLSDTNTVQRTDICYIFNNELYCLKGEKTNDKEAGYISEYFDENKKIAQESFGQANCTVTDSTISCTLNGVTANVNSNGALSVTDGTSTCSTTNAGVSSCS